MANLACFVACALLVAVSAERISNSRDSTSRDRDTGSSRDRDSSSSGGRDFGFDSDRNTGSGSRASSVQSNRGSSTGSRWGDDADAENDFSTPKITAWKGGVIPYEIASDISANNARALKNMFADISEKTCVRFVAKRSSDSNYVSIKSGNKCSAPLGMSTGTTSSGRQSSFTSGSVSNVVLGQSCFTTKRVGRRIMNLLGLPHETSRPDRDQFVEINMSNLRSGYANNIKQVATSAYLPGVLDVPYDLQSITQYSDDDLAKDASTWAIRAKGRSRSSTSQQLGGDTFSSADFQKINKAYNCPSSGRSSSSRN